MKKRITVVLFALLLVCTVCFSFAACGDKSDTDCKHTYGKWVTVKEPTCTEQGSRERTCTKCENKETESIQATGVHTYGKWVTVKEPTCTEQGSRERTCTKCENKETESIQATGVHTYGEWVTVKEPACTEQGSRERTCSVCKDKQTEVISARHKYGDDGICTVCGRKVTLGLKYSEIKENDTVIGYAVTGIGSATDTDIVIPEIYNDLPVIYIGEKAFSSCRSLTSVIIPDSVTYIGSDAFYYCGSLECNEKDGIKYLGNETNPYVVAVGVTSYDITTANIENGCKVIYGAFDTCRSLTSVTIPDSVTSIGENAFDGCSGLTSATIGNGVISIEKDAFYGCSDLTSITIGNSVTSIGYEAFRDCTSLKNITIPDSVTSIGSHAFYYCDNLKYNEKDGIKYLGNKTNPYVIVMDAISNITTANIENGCKVIDYDAFSYCWSLTSVIIPDSVIYIGIQAFEACDSLEYNEKDGIKYLGNETNLYVIVMEVTSDDITAVNIENGCKVIGRDAFYGCSGLTSITIPDSVTSIGEYAFRGCTSLTSITIPHSVTSIGEYAFYGCSGLTSITIGNGVTSIGDWVFSDCTSLKSITIPDNVISIGSFAFYGCSDLTSITIGNGVTSIGDRAFGDCTSLTSITIPDNVISIGKNVFFRSGLTNITIGNGVTSIGKQAFYDCTSLSDIYCKATSEPIGWDGRWKDRCSATVHWGNEWEYVDGVPTVKQN